MKKVLSVLAVSAFVLTAGVALAGGPGKKDAGCPAACQQQIDDLNSSQAQQNEQLGAHGKQLVNHEGRIKALELSSAWYGRVGGRMAWESKDAWAKNDASSDIGWGGALALGRQFGQFRAEVELAYQKADLSKYVGANTNTYSGSGALTTVMANGYYEVPVADAFSVYGMLGVGYARENSEDKNVTTNTTLNSRDNNAIAYKAGVGMSYAFTETVAGDLGYEYLAAAVDNFNTHNIVASVRFKF